jgi:hypothetical protein
MFQDQLFALYCSSVKGPADGALRSVKLQHSIVMTPGVDGFWWIPVIF